MRTLRCHWLSAHKAAGKLVAACHAYAKPPEDLGAQLPAWVYCKHQVTPYKQDKDDKTIRVYTRN